MNGLDTGDPWSISDAFVETWPRLLDALADDVAREIVAKHPGVSADEVLREVFYNVRIRFGFAPSRGFGGAGEIQRYVAACAPLADLG